MELRTDALLLRAVDYGENDKMVTLLTAERGKVGASMKGVRRKGAKLQFAAQPFCFAEYVLWERGDRRTVTSACLHEGFYPLREDVKKFYGGVSVLEACDAVALEGMACGELIVAAVGALEAMCAGDPAPALLRFLLAALQFAGYPVRAERCPVCGAEPSGRMAFDMESGTFGCTGCLAGVPASEKTYVSVRAAAEGRENSDADGVKRALKLLHAYFLCQTDAKLSALKEFIGLL